MQSLVCSGPIPLRRARSQSKKEPPVVVQSLTRFVSHLCSRDGVALREALRSAYIGASVHRIVSADLRVICRTLEEGRAACRGLPSATGLAGMPALFDALLMMLQCSAEGEAEAAHHTAEASPRQGRAPTTPEGSCERGGLAWRSVSTATPDSSPAASYSPTGRGIGAAAAPTASLPPSRWVALAPGVPIRRHLSETWGADVEQQRHLAAAKVRQTLGGRSCSRMRL